MPVALQTYSKKGLPNKMFLIFFFFLSLLGCCWCNLIPLHVGLGSLSDKGSLCELRVAHQTNRVFLWNRSDLGRGIGHSRTYQGWFHCLKSPLCKKAAWQLQLSLRGREKIVTLNNNANIKDSVCLCVNKDFIVRVFKLNSKLACESKRYRSSSWVLH